MKNKDPAICKLIPDPNPKLEELRALLGDFMVIGSMDEVSCWERDKMIATMIEKILEILDEK